MRSSNAGLAALLALALIGCGTDAVEQVVKAPPVMVERVVARSVVDSIEATGELVAVDEARIAAEVSGRVTAVRVKEGAAVEPGDIVVEIDRERRELELASRRALVAEGGEEIAKEERELRRVRQLHEQSAASKAQLDAAETRLRRARSRREAAQAQLGLSERALRDASVTAPFPGFIARRHVSVGDYVSVGRLLFELVALDPVEVEFHLTERDSGRVEIGDAVEVRVASHPDETFFAIVNVVSPRIDPVTRTLRVKGALGNEDGRLRPGLFARADLGVARRENVPMLPEDAILQRSDGAVVFVLVDGRSVERRNVRTGIYRDGYVEAIDGVRAGEVVVVRGQARLVDGSVVELREADGSAAPGELAGTPEPSGTTP